MSIREGELVYEIEVQDIFLYFSSAVRFYVKLNPFT